MRSGLGSVLLFFRYRTSPSSILGRCVLQCSPLRPCAGIRGHSPLCIRSFLIFSAISEGCRAGRRQQIFPVQQNISSRTFLPHSAGASPAFISVAVTGRFSSMLQRHVTTPQLPDIPQTAAEDNAAAFPDLVLSGGEDAPDEDGFRYLLSPSEQKAVSYPRPHGSGARFSYQCRLRMRSDCRQRRRPCDRG